MEYARVVLALCTVASVCVIGCSKPSGKAAPPSPAPAALPPPPRRPASVNIDNSTPSACDVYIDGATNCTLPPLAVAQVRLPSGMHAFEFLSGGQTIDSIAVELDPKVTTVINPLGAASYSLRVVTYSGIPGLSSRAPNTIAVLTQRVVKADFGLLEPLPDSIMLQTDFSRHSMQATKSKIFRRLGHPVTLEDALRILAGNPCLYGSGSKDASESPFEEAMELLRKESARNPAVLDAVVKRLDSVGTDRPDEAVLVARLVPIVESHSQAIPSEFLTRWVAAPSADSYGPGAARAGYAASALLNRHDEGAILGAFDALPPANKIAILRASVGKGSNAYRSRLISSALKQSNAEIDTAVATVIESNFDPDPAIAGSVEDRIAGLSGTESAERKRRERLEGAWIARLAHGAPGLDPEFVARRLLAAAQTRDSSMAERAVAGLIRHEGSSRLAQVYPGMTPDARRYAMSCEARRASEANPSPTDATTLLSLGLGDTNASVRAAAFDGCLGIYSKRGGAAILSTLQSTQGQTRTLAIGPSGP